MSAMTREMDTLNIERLESRFRLQEWACGMWRTEAPAGGDHRA
jgi:hypothetical protein